MELQEIAKQVVESPLTKEESKEQFIRLTKQHNIKHTFDFDEAWEVALQLRRRKEFRQKINELQDQLILNDNSFKKDTVELQETNPVKHSFADGCYIREIYNPANEIIITSIHAQSHPFFLMQGKMSILTEEGIINIEAPHYGITKPGTKRIIYTHTPCVFVTVHATDLTDPELIDKEVIAETFEDPRVTKEDMKLINKFLPL